MLLPVIAALAPLTSLLTPYKTHEPTPQAISHNQHADNHFLALHFTAFITGEPSPSPDPQTLLTSTGQRWEAPPVCPQGKPTWSAVCRQGLGSGSWPCPFARSVAKQPLYRRRMRTCPNRCAFRHRHTMDAHRAAAAKAPLQPVAPVHALGALRVIG